MERYFYLICFAAYALEHGPTNYQKSFKSWMDDHNELRQQRALKIMMFLTNMKPVLKLPQVQTNQLQTRSMIDSGKDKLEWYRTVDAAKLDHLKEMMLQVAC